MSKSKSLKLPVIGRFGVQADRHGDGFAGAAIFKTNLSVRVFDKDGNERKVRSYFGSNRFQKALNAVLYRNQTLLDLGSGLVTNVGVASMTNDFNWASPATAINTLKLANFHATGTGVTAAAATDFKLQTVSTFGGQTPIAGVQSIDPTSTMAVPKYKSVATITYTGTEAVTEWGLHSSNVLSSTTGTPLTAVAATNFTATSAPFTASSSTVQGLQGQIIIAGTTTVMGIIASNTVSVGTLWNNGTTGWFTQAGQVAGATPGSTEAYTLRPIMWDHKVFAAVNVNNGDSIQFSYTLQINSGG